MRERKNISRALNNPKIQSITWKSLRHFKATMEYLRTKGTLHVMGMLGHKNIQNTLKYIHLAKAICSVPSNYACRVAHSAEEARILIETGFEYVATTPEGLMLFGKPK